MYHSMDTVQSVGLGIARALYDFHQIYNDLKNGDVITAFGLLFKVDGVHVVNVENAEIKEHRWTFKQVYSYSHKVTKPNPKIYKILLNKLKTRPNQCLFVDDRRENVAAAKRAGMRGLVFKSNTRLFSEIGRYLFQLTRSTASR